MMMNDVESNLQETHVEPEMNTKTEVKRGHMLKESCAVSKEDRRKRTWKLLLFLFIVLGVMIGFACFWMAFYAPHLTFSSVSKHIKPIKPLHHGKVVYLISQTMEGDIIYKRVITAPCAYGILLFNIGPAVSNEC